MASLELEARLDNLLATAQTETANIDIFAPIPEREECPICLLPLPIKENETLFMSCCGKSICNGCVFRHNRLKKRQERKCAFCQLSMSHNNIKANRKLMKKNNPTAFMQMASYYNKGDRVIQSDTKALEMRISAAELGVAKAYTLIGHHYDDGTAVETNASKAFAFCEIVKQQNAC